MEHTGATDGEVRDGAAPPGQWDDAQQEATREEQAGRVSRQTVPQRRSTRGGSGTAAGSTPKKAYRPSTTSRSRPGGKRPDAGPH